MTCISSVYILLLEHKPSRGALPNHFLRRWLLTALTGIRWDRPESASLDMTTDMILLSSGLPSGLPSGKGRIVTTALVLVFLMDSLCAFGDSRTGGAYPALTDLMVLEDAGSELSFEEVRNGDAPFASQKEDVFRFENIDHPVWLKAKLPAMETGGARPVLSISSPVIREAALYLPVPGKNGIEYRRLEGGLSRSLPPEDWRYRYMIYDLPEETMRYEWIYLRFDTGGLSANFRMALSDPATLRLSGWKMMIYLFSGMGILAGMGLFNAILFLRIRDRSYLTYALYILSMLLYIFFHSGSGRIVGIPGAVRFTLPVSCVSCLFALMFSHDSLDLGKTPFGVKLVRRSLVLVSAAALVLWFSGLTGTAGRTILILRLLLPPVLIYVCLLRIRQGFLPARLFLPAWIVMGLSATILGLAEAGFIPYQSVGSHAPAAGAAAEAVCLSMALGNRTRFLGREKRRLQEEELRFAELSIKDELTGLYNRSGYDSKSAMLYDWAAKNGKELSLLVLGVDRFKAFEDSHGHAEGDRVLQALARSIRNSIRDRDVACRFGGEEFAVILPGSSEKDACLIAERLRKSVEGKGLVFPDGRETICTVSIGVSTMEGGDEGGVSLFKRAHSGMLRAKRGGRNRVMAGGSLICEVEIPR